MDTEDPSTPSAEHLDWAVARAREYVDAGDGNNAMASLVSDLNKHPGTRALLRNDLLAELTDALLEHGAQGVEHFIAERLPQWGAA